MDSREELVTFSPFVVNAADPMRLFDDAALHWACFDRHPLAGKVREFMALLPGKESIGNFNCAVCNQHLVYSTDYMNMGLLISDEKVPLYVFNFTKLHQSHLPDWPQLEIFAALIQEGLDNGRLKGYGITHLMGVLNEALLQRVRVKSISQTATDLALGALVGRAGS